MGVSRGGLDTRAESTLLAERAAQFLKKGPADPVSLIGYVCNLPGAPRIVAEHMADAIFAGRPEFFRDDSGRWLLTAPIDETAAVDPDLLTQLSFAVVDLETTGTSHYAGDRIIEVAAVIVRNGEIVEVFESLVNPDRPISPFVSRLTQITWAMVKDAPRFAEIEPKLMDVLTGHVFVAHNSNFDWRFLASEIRRASGRELFGRRMCTVRLARQILPQLSRRSLDYLAAYYGVKIKNRHRAGGDAIATAQCLTRLLDDAADRGCKTWDDLNSLAMYRRKRPKKRRRSALPGPAENDRTA